MSNDLENVATPLYTPKIKVARMRDDVQLPKQAHATDAGFDLHSTERVDLPPGQSMLVGTGLRMEIPEGYCGQINPRSSIASKHKVIVGARIIDAAYRGEVKINLINLGAEPFEVVVGMRVAQIVFLPVLGHLVEVEESELTDTVRGEGGFGSTGDK